MSHDSLTSKREITTSSLWSLLVYGLPRSRTGDSRPSSFPDICQNTDKRITSLAILSTNPKQTLLHVSVRPNPYTPQSVFTIPQQQYHRPDHHYPDQRC